MYKIKSKIVFRILNYCERIFSLAQGKGYGSSTVKKEVSSLSNLLVRSPKIAMDIGGNVGNYSAELLNRWPNLIIHIFEPSSTNIQKLNIRFNNYPNVFIHPFALSNFDGESLLFADEAGSGMGSLSKRDLNHLGINEFNNTENIKVINGENFWIKNIGKSPDIIKLDIEGHELNALNGLGCVIDQAKVIQFEFGGCNIDTKTYFKDFFTFFTNKNFNVYRITPIGVELISKYRESDEFFVTTNYLALNNNK
jgi:FkbM family methyltransferase